MAEISEIRTDQGSTRSVAVESADPARVLAVLRSPASPRARTCAWPAG